jgi:NMD protein affecting ribosome stability and mRNA decay
MPPVLTIQGPKMQLARMSVAHLLVLCLGVLLPLSSAMKGFGRKKEVVPAIKSDIKHIRCEVCQHVAANAYRNIAQLRALQPKWKVLSEEEILAKLEHVCNSQKEEGEWITHLDVQQEGSKLRVVQMEKVRGSTH